jgi:ribonuclease BN (tRNA processing enzyme)
MMEVIFLGTGSGWPRLERQPTSLLIKVGGKNILIDMGPGITRRLLETKHTLSDIDYLFISHFHPDHISDFIPFLQSVRYNLGYKKDKPLLIIGGKGFKKFYKNLRKLFRHLVDAGNKVIIKDLVNKEIVLGKSIKVKTLRVPHNKESIAFRIEYNGKSLVYSGDTKFSEKLVEFSRNADFFILECAVPNGVEGEDHLNPELAARILKEAHAKKVAFVHLFKETENSKEIRNFEKIYHQKVIIAKDLMRIKVK